VRYNVIRFTRATRRQRASKVGETLLAGQAGP